ncbi:hypothetical protein GLW08_10770 [Pontibacillus yanchengensis]|uniref:Uncharacterized protein n=2 Tax=Pontibacillus yanchengensis TaxID=462910 RepID=A0ACC7VI63_9BACI|nr:DUF6366 family protein [Pontibacillus yanchengensis]MYL34351.1 hypothetical protein [Pontibacillus yanchengensis]MYL53819.1 hypothetical protein [Pontibacillus yanchengensis]
MSKDSESPEQRREELRQKELNNPSSSVHGSNLADLVGGLGWKGTGVLIILMVVGGFIIAWFFR